MTELPTGIVTFLFTDIEGSTPLWEREPDAMRQSLALHNAILEDAITLHDGVVFKFVGDAFQAAFLYPSQALKAAIEIQRRLSEASWSTTGALRVRIGLHIGPAEIQGSEYVSHTLNRVSQVMSAAHGGQILLTSAVAELIHGQLTDGASLRDMGMHHLKGMTQLEHLFQVVVPDLPSEFPPLIVFDQPLNNLPLSLTSFVGREKEIEAVNNLLKNAHLVTLTGSGGVGKTRLAIEVGRQRTPVHSDGVWLIELAPLTDPQLVPQALADVLGVREAQDRPLLDSLVDFLRNKQSLLIIDNCEHLLAACAHAVDKLLRACSKVTILASSREALGLAGEQPFVVPNLSLPDDEEISQENMASSEALQLFIERAQTVLPGFHLTVENMTAAVKICRRLDGIPLAVELAAARVKTLRIEQISQRLDDLFRLLTGGSRTALPRQQTLRATIDWSYGLLSQAERHLLEHLSIFSDGCTLEAAEEICPGDDIDVFEILDLLTSLSNKSMVAVDRHQGREPRFRLLETIRQYAREKLFESGEITTLRDRHLRYFLEWAEMADPQTRGSEQVVWLEWIDREHENLLSALEWSRDRDPEKGLRLAGSLGFYWWLRNKWTQAVQWLSSFLQNPQNKARNHSRAYALGRLSFIMSYAMRFAEVEKMSFESLSISQEIGDQTGEAFAYYLLGWINYQRKNDYAVAQSYFGESLKIYQALGDQWGLARILLNLGNMEGFQGNMLSQRDYLERSLAACRQAGDLRGIAIALNNLASVVINVECDLEKGRRMVEESIDIYHQLKALGDIDNALIVYIDILAFQGEYSYARSISQELLDISIHRGDPSSIIRSKINLGFLDRLEGENEQAAAIFEECLADFNAIDVDERHRYWSLMVLYTEMGLTLTNLENYSRAKDLLEEAYTISNHPLDRAIILQGLGMVATAQKERKAALAYFHQCLLILHDSNYRIFYISALEDYACALHLVAQDNRATHILGSLAEIRRQIGAPLPLGYQPRHERLLADLRAGLGEIDFNQAWIDGQLMTLQKTLGTALDEAMASALDEYPM